MRASENEHPDLFWGLRGGGGNFGVVTAIDFELHPLGPEIFGGPVAWRAESAPEVLEAFRKHANEAPPELPLVAVMRKAPPAPWIDKSAHGQLIVMLLACYTGKLEEGEKLLAPLKALGKPVGDLLQRRPYVTLQSLLDATQPKGRRYRLRQEPVAARRDQGALGPRQRLPGEQEHRAVRPWLKRRVAGPTATAP